MKNKNIFLRGDLIKGWNGVTYPKRQIHCGKFVRLEPLETRHLKPLYTIFLESPKQDWYYMPFGPFKNQQEFKEWATQKLNQTDPMFFTILKQNNNKVLGFLSYLNINQNHGSIEIGFIQFSKKSQKTTEATEAIWLLLNHAFYLGYRRVEWKCDSLNERSRKAAKRLGFSFEGVFRQALVVKGRNRDTAWYSIIDSEWSELDSIYQNWLNRIYNSDSYISLSELTQNRF